MQMDMGVGTACISDEGTCLSSPAMQMAVARGTCEYAVCKAAPSDSSHWHALTATTPLVDVQDVSSFFTLPANIHATPLRRTPWSAGITRSGALPLRI